MRHGMGKFFTIGGYTYTGEFQFGVKQGYGVEFNNPTDQNVDAEYREGFLYEGEFWNNVRNGTGKLMTSEGNYYFGGFNGGFKDGIGFSFLREDGSYEINLWV